MIQLDSHDMLGRPVKIKPGLAKSAEHTPDQTRSPFALDRWRRQDNPSCAKINSDSSQRVYVGGLPRWTEREAMESNMQTFFHGYIMYVLVPLLFHVVDTDWF